MTETTSTNPAGRDRRTDADPRSALAAADQAVENGVREFILVMPNAFTAFEGSVDYINHLKSMT